MTSRQAPSPSTSLRALGVISPVAAVLIASPITVGAVGRIPDADGMLIVAPTTLALLAAPGYLRAVVGWSSIPSLTATERLWVRCSFVNSAVPASLAAPLKIARNLPIIGAYAMQRDAEPPVVTR